MLSLIIALFPVALAFVVLYFFIRLIIDDFDDHGLNFYGVFMMLVLIGAAVGLVYLVYAAIQIYLSGQPLHVPHTN